MRWLCCLLITGFVLLGMWAASDEEPPTKTIGPFHIGKGIPGVITFGMSSSEVRRTLGKGRTYEEVTGKTLISDGPGKFYDPLCGWINMTDKVYRFTFSFVGSTFPERYRLLLMNQQESIMISQGLAEKEFVQHTSEQMPKTGFHSDYKSQESSHYFNKDRNCYIRFRYGRLESVEFYDKSPEQAFMEASQLPGKK